MWRLGDKVMNIDHTFVWHFCEDDYITLDKWVIGCWSPATHVSEVLYVSYS